MLINLLLMSIGAFIGMMATSMCIISKIEDERTSAYFRGLERGRREGRAEGRNHGKNN